jgi:hypothetical protein
MKGHDYCMFHCDILIHQKSLPKLHECVEEKLREGFKFGTIHIPHSNYNWACNEIINSIEYLAKHHNLRCKVGVTNTKVYRPRFKTKEDYLQYVKRKEDSWSYYHNEIESESESFIEFMIEFTLLPIIMIIIIYTWYYMYN